MLRAIPPTGVRIEPGDIWPTFNDTIRGKDFIGLLKEEIRRYFGVRYCFLVSSGRAALALLLLAIKNASGEIKKDEVILPAYTSFSVPSAAVKAGLRISLCDLDPETLSLDADSLKAAITERTLCVVVSHLFGYPCDMDAVRRITGEAGIFVVDDAAQSIGAKYKGKFSGTLGDAGIFSLSRGKNITAVEGGIIVTDSERLSSELEVLVPRKEGLIAELTIAAKALMMSVLLKPSCYWIPQGIPLLRLGASVFSPDFKIKGFTAMQAGIGLRMLKRLQSINERRKDRARLLMSQLNDCGNICFPRKVPGAEPVYLRLPVSYSGPSEIGSRKLGIVRSYPCPLSDIMQLRPYLNNDRKVPGARFLAENIWTLPTHDFLRARDIRELAEHLKSVE